MLFDPWTHIQSMTRTLLILTAIFEAATGLLLMIWPSEVLALLFGPNPAIPLGSTGGRVAGVVLLFLGIACWMTRDHGQRPSGKRMVSTMLTYNVAVAAALAAVGVRYGLHGIVLWLAVIAHVALAVWCVASLRRGAPAASA
jgi:hypothetical protein